jgi:hypothetical protein
MKLEGKWTIWCLRCRRAASSRLHQQTPRQAATTPITIISMTTTSDNNGNHNHNKKRPRPSDYYDRLLFQCQKDLHKHAKQTKQFEVQKLIRQLKCIPDEDHQTKNRLALSSKLQELKDYDLEPVVQECVRQLGLAALNPNLGSTGDDGPSSSTIQIGEPLAPCWMRDRIVHHTRLKATIEKWHEEVTKYRRWSLVKSEKEEGSKFVSRENSLFVQLGATSASTTTGGGRGSSKTTRAKKTTAEGPVDTSYYGPATGGLLDEDGGTNRTKKNRQGQRARKAKALAVAARKEGRMLLPEESVNWRPAKKHRPSRDDEASSSTGGGHFGAEEGRAADTLRSTNDDPTKQHASKSDNHNNKNNNNETLHPSWQARKDKKDCIVAFQGKKITF